MLLIHTRVRSFVRPCVTLQYGKGVRCQGRAGGDPQLSSPDKKITRGTVMIFGFVLAPPPPKPNPGYALAVWHSRNGKRTCEVRLGPTHELRKTLLLQIAAVNCIRKAKTVQTEVIHKRTERRKEGRGKAEEDPEAGARGGESKFWHLSTFLFSAMRSPTPKESECHEARDTAGLGPPLIAFIILSQPHQNVWSAMLVSSQRRTPLRLQHQSYE